MSARPLAAVIGLSLLGSACGDRVPRGRPWDEEPSSVLVAVDPSLPVGLDSVRAVPAPPVRFLALLETDLNHPVGVSAQESGRLLWVREPGTVSRGDTLAVLRPLKSDSSRDLAIVADHRGTWWPGRSPGETAWAGEPVGLLRWPGYVLAVGAVPDYQGGAIHAGDSARVSWPGSRAPIVGRVEWARAPGPSNPYSAEVAVEIRDHAGSSRLPSSPIEVEVIPTGPADSAYAVPKTAVVSVGSSHVIFEVLGTGRYLAHFVIPGPEVGGLIIVRSGADHRMPAAVDGLAPLIRALEDSLRRRGR